MVAESEVPETLTVHIEGLPPVVVLHEQAVAVPVATKPKGGVPDRVLVVYPNPTLRQALRQLCVTLGIVVCSFRRACRGYCGTINRAYVTKNYWFRGGKNV